MIYLTQPAVKKLKEIADSEGIKASIRIKVQGGACSGTKNDISFDEIIKDLDEVIIQDDIQIIIDCMSYQYLDESIIDYLENDFSSGFKFNIPNAKSSCGCGSSYAY